MTKLIAYDPDDRVSARQALRYAYFRELRQAEKKAAAQAQALAIASSQHSTPSATPRATPAAAPSPAPSSNVKEKERRAAAEEREPAAGSTSKLAGSGSVAAAAPAPEPAPSAAATTMQRRANAGGKEKEKRNAGAASTSNLPNMPKNLVRNQAKVRTPGRGALRLCVSLPAHKMLPLCLGRGVNLFVAAHQIESALAKSEQDVVELILEIVEVLFVQAAEVESPGLHESCTQARRRWRWRWRRPQKMTRYVVRVSRNDPKKMQRFCLGVHCLSRERRGAATPARSRRHRCALQGQRQARSRGHRGARSRAPLGGNWAALAPQASVHSRHGWAVVHAEKMCPTGRVRSHCAAERSAGATTRSLEVVPGAAVREFSCIAETCWLPSLCSLLHCGCRRYPRRAGAACLRASKWLQCLGCPPGPGVAGMWGRGVAALRRPAPAALVPARRMSSRSAFQLPWESKPQEISKVRAYSAAQNFPAAEHRDPLNVPRRSTGAQVVAADHPGQLQ